MRAANRRHAFLQADLAEAVFCGSRMEGKELQRYCDGLRGIDRTLPPEALAAAIEAAAKDKPEMSWKQFFAERKR